MCLQTLHGVEVVVTLIQGASRVNVNVESGTVLFLFKGTSYGDSTLTTSPTTLLPNPIQGILNISITKTDGSTTTVAEINSLLNTSTGFYHPYTAAMVNSLLYKSNGYTNRKCFWVSL